MTSISIFTTATKEEKSIVLAPHTTAASFPQNETIQQLVERYKHRATSSSRPPIPTPAENLEDWLASGPKRYRGNTVPSTRTASARAVALKPNSSSDIALLPLKQSTSIISLKTTISESSQAQFTVDTVHSTKATSVHLTKSAAVECKAKLVEPVNKITTASASTQPLNSTPSTRIIRPASQETKIAERIEPFQARKEQESSCVALQVLKEKTKPQVTGIKPACKLHTTFAVPRSNTLEIPAREFQAKYPPAAFFTLAKTQSHPPSRIPISTCPYTRPSPECLSSKPQAHPTLPPSPAIPPSQLHPAVTTYLPLVATRHKTSGASKRKETTL
ncbi:hypothetical protein BP5796_04574 [Coleophoma crateriformis]|uniref:Uncharacterized protein n=1 Tax=Coleophoma crateriformis TaxID=565419 RepID=A0A3D8S9Y1_9HELO|nr:hypothetical protein BP5796_04574 [Coleophoma crateriformis]